MRLDQLEHLLRAAGELLAEDVFVVIGSQAILASLPTLDDRVLTRSLEADLMPLDDPDEAKADMIDGVLGAGSMFDHTHGIHADGVSASTPVLPDGWRERLREIVSANTNGVRGLCLEPHDPVVSKLVAGRAKDLEFCRAAAHAGLVDPHVLEQRIEITALTEPTRSRVLGYIRKWTVA